MDWLDIFECCNTLLFLWCKPSSKRLSVVSIKSVETQQLNQITHYTTTTCVNCSLRLAYVCFLHMQTFSREQKECRSTFGNRHFTHVRFRHMTVLIPYVLPFLANYLWISHYFSHSFPPKSHYKHSTFAHLTCIEIPHFFFHPHELLHVHYQPNFTANTPHLHT